MRISDNGIFLIKDFEAFVPLAYNLKDSNIPGKILWTVGYGHTSTAYEGMTVTEEEARELLRRDLNEAERCVNSYVSVKLNQNQFDALVSFVFNVGCPAFRGSTLLRRLHAGEIEKIPFELNKWIYDNGKVLNGLIRRRATEGELFTRPVNITPLPAEPNLTPLRTVSPGKTITPVPVREERRKLSESRTAKGVGTGLFGMIGTYVSKFFETVPWFDHALAAIVILSLLWILYCRRDDIRKAVF